MRCVAVLVVMALAGAARGEHYKVYLGDGQSQATIQWCQGAELELNERAAAAGLPFRFKVLQRQRGGAPVEWWRSGDYPAGLLDTHWAWFEQQLAGMVAQGHTVEVVGVLWWQGETDIAGNGAQYVRDTLWVWREYARRAGKKFKQFRVGLMIVDADEQHQPYPGGRTEADVQRMRGWQHRFTKLQNVCWFDTMGAPRTDWVHVEPSQRPLLGRAIGLMLWLSHVRGGAL